MPIVNMTIFMLMENANFILVLGLSLEVVPTVASIPYLFCSWNCFPCSSGLWRARKPFLLRCLGHHYQSFSSLIIVGPSFVLPHSAIIFGRTVTSVDDTASYFFLLCFNYLILACNAKIWESFASVAFHAPLEIMLLNIDFVNVDSFSKLCIFAPPFQLIYSGWKY